ncbi:hypothetical protein [Thalassolituus sp.]|uniref:hypothetical protein n=1 Tax=Thalassolituus sp. TaxID=2030822 RepID=UPI002A7EE57F|nr:hypothetical protein [Thalassolituus sp.]
MPNPLESHGLRVSIRRARDNDDSLAADTIIQAFNDGLARRRADGRYTTLLDKHRYPHDTDELAAH